jgi:hypothetical protein
MGPGFFQKEHPRLEAAAKAVSRQTIRAALFILVSYVSRASSRDNFWYFFHSM